MTSLFMDAVTLPIAYLSRLFFNVIFHPEFRVGGLLITCYPT